MDEQQLYLFIGAGSHIILWLSYKKLKNLKLYLILIIAALGLAIFGYLNLSCREYSAA